MTFKLAFPILTILILIPGSCKNTETPPRSAAVKSSSTSAVIEDSTLGHLDLKTHSPVEGLGDAQELFDTGFSTAEALMSMKQINGILDDFRKLTEQARKKLGKDAISRIPNTADDMQMIGFQNIPLAIEGTIRKKEYQIRKLEYEIAKVNYDSGKLRIEELTTKRDALREATKQFQTFWDSVHFGD